MINEFELKKKEDDISRIKRGFRDDLSGANIEAYRDSEGMTISKLDAGLWYVEHREKIKTVSYFSLFLFGFFSLLYFLFEYGSYAISGIPIQASYAREVMQRSLPTYEFYHAGEARDLQLYPIQILAGAGEKKDVYTRISNPNLGHWARFRYYFLWGGEKLGWEEGFVLPGETKDLFLLGQELPESVGGIRIVIEDIQWGRPNPHDIGIWEDFRKERLDFRFSNIEFLQGDTAMLSEKIAVNELSFIMENNSSFSYWNVPLTIKLYNYSDLASVVSYQVNDLAASAKRSISLSLPGNIKKVTEIKIEPNLDITRKDIYKLPGGH